MKQTTFRVGDWVIVDTGSVATHYSQGRVGQIMDILPGFTYGHVIEVLLDGLRLDCHLSADEIRLATEQERLQYALTGKPVSRH